MNSEMQMELLKKELETVKGKMSELRKSEKEIFEKMKAIRKSEIFNTECETILEMKQEESIEVLDLNIRTYNKIQYVNERINNYKMKNSPEIFNIECLKGLISFLANYETYYGKYAATKLPESMYFEVLEKTANCLKSQTGDNEEAV